MLTLLCVCVCAFEMTNLPCAFKCVTAVTSVKDRNVAVGWGSGREGQGSCVLLRLLGSGRGVGLGLLWGVLVSVVTRGGLFLDLGQRIL